MAVKTANLTIVFIDLKGYTSRTAIQTREEHVEMLRRFRVLVQTSAKAFRGTMVKGIGDAFLITFRSPTDAALFGVAAQDYFWKYNQEIDQGKWLEVRVAINVGEVALEGGDVFGEAVNIASRVESLGDAGDVLVTEAVYLSMNKAEVPTEELGEFELKGVPNLVRIHRTKRVSSGKKSPPYGGHAMQRVEALEQQDWTHGMGASLKSLPGKMHLPEMILPRWLSAMNLGAVGEKLGSLRPQSYKIPAMVLGSLLLLGGLIALLLLVFPDPYADVRDLFERDQHGQAVTALENHLEQNTPEWYALMGHALTQQRKYNAAAEVFTKALSGGLAPDEEPYLIPDALEGMDRQQAGASKDLFEKKIGKEGIEALLSGTENIRYWFRWNSVHVLRALGAEDRIDYCQVYILDLLHAGSCETRRRAAVKLAKVGDERALEPLTRAKDRSEEHNHCMGNALDDAIREINSREGD